MKMEMVLLMTLIALTVKLQVLEMENYGVAVKELMNRMNLLILNPMNMVFIIKLQPNYLEPVVMNL